MPNFQQVLDEVKQIDWAVSTVSFFVATRKMHMRVANYDDALHVNTDSKLRKKMKKTVLRKIKNSKTALKYDFNTSDQDNDFLGMPLTNDSFVNFLSLIDSMERILKSDPIQYAKSADELKNASLYAIRLKSPHQRNPLFAIRRIPAGWSIKDVSSILANMSFKDQMLIDLDYEDIFRVDEKVDFFVFNNVIFIADKKNFEFVMNFRKGMEKNRDEIVKEFKERQLISNPDRFSELVGDNMRRLRKLSQVKKSEYYKDPEFMETLRKVNDERNWGIQYSGDGKIIVSEENIEKVLRALNEDLLTSEITQNDYAVDAKRKME